MTRYDQRDQNMMDILHAQKHAVKEPKQNAKLINYFKSNQDTIQLI